VFGRAVANPADLFLMAYTVLARKYRSQTFDDVVGQEPIAQTLKNAIKNQQGCPRLSFHRHARRWQDNDGRILAKSLNCLKADGPTTEPCCKCDSCLAVNLGEDIDVIEIDGAQIGE